jgi:hypothetical protein
MPAPTGSATFANTMGMVRVACCNEAGVADARTTKRDQFSRVSAAGPKDALNSALPPLTLTLRPRAMRAGRAGPRQPSTAQPADHISN